MSSRAYRHYLLTEDNFKIRSYGFQELATLYLPNIQPRSASARLKIWITRNKSLVENLRDRGWVPGCKVLTPEMVRSIVNALGEPRLIALYAIGKHYELTLSQNLIVISYVKVLVIKFISKRITNKFILPNYLGADPLFIVTI